MKVIDARSGKEARIGERISYPDGEWIRLVDVDPGLFSATATVVICSRHPRTDELVTRTLVDVPLIVRWMHPRFMLQHVAFLPS